jgi:hypothetical protein
VYTRGYYCGEEIDVEVLAHIHAFTYVKAVFVTQSVSPYVRICISLATERLYGLCSCSVARVFGTKRHEMVGAWRKLRIEKLHNLYCSPNVIRMIKSRRMRRPGHVGRMGAKRNAYRILVGKAEGKRQLGRPRNGWEDDIKMDLGEIGWGSMDWINLSEDRDQWKALVKKIMILRVP